jgi:hypothetical protein
MKYLLQHEYLRESAWQRNSLGNKMCPRRVLLIFGQVIGSGKGKYAFIAMNEEQ